jgi:amino acid adenylation domain-containing protein/non-ribosomal peptide synthase protein (TIGR01720 family)
VGDVLAAIWRDLLRIERVGSHDNFYRLGGDSLQAITMIHRARQRGLVLTMQQVVGSANLDELAAQVTVLDSRATDEAAVLPIGEPFGLTPVQCWFFEQDFAAPDEISQFQIVSMHELDEERLTAALSQVVAKHDAFRLQFPRIDGRRQQVYAENVPPVTLRWADLTGASDADQALQAIAAEWLRDFDFERGRTLTCGVVRGHPDGRVRLFVGLHHLICDGISWRVLLEDLRGSYFGGHAAPASSGTPLHAWSGALHAYARDPRTESNVESWINAKSIPHDFRRSRHSGRVIQLDLSTDLDDVLPAAPAAVLQEKRMEILLTAFAVALSEWTSSPRVAMQLEGHGREAVGGVAPGHGVGWYTSLFPALFELPPDGDLLAAFHAVAKQYREIPDRGLSYGALRYLHPDPIVRAALAGKDSPVLFNYLGSFNNHEREDDWQLYDDDAAQDVIAPANRRHTRLEINCSIVDRRFVCRLDCDAELLPALPAQRLGQRFLDLAGQLSLALAEADDAERRALPAGPADWTPGQPWHPQWGRVLRTYPLTPLQEGMLFHHNVAASGDEYFVQVLWRYPSVPDSDRMREAWTNVAAETDVLRSFFHWEQHGRPQQCVVENAPFDFLWSDISAMDAAAQEQWIEEWLRTDRARGFDVARPGLFRIHFIQRGSDCCELVLSNHHIILDGWSLPLLLTRVHEWYGEPLQPPREASGASFEDFVAHGNGRDTHAADRYFRTRATGVEWSIDVPVRRAGAELDPHKGVTSFGEVYLTLPEDETRALLSLQRDEGITPGTLLMFSLGTVLSAYNEERPALFGLTVSGRNHDLPELDTLAGLTINTLPLLFEPTPDGKVRAALSEMQLQIAQLTEYSAYPLRALEDSGQNRFNVLAVFENYPGQDQVGSGALRAELTREIENTGYPLTIIYRILGGRLQIKLIYDQSAFSAPSMERMARHLRNVALQAASSPDRSCAGLELPDAQEAFALTRMLRGPEVSHSEERIEEVFAAQVAARPDRLALRAGARSFTYAELDRIATSLSDMILAAALPPGTLIALVAERSPELVQGMLAILKARCAYLPLDSNSPLERNRRILDDAGAEYILAFGPAAEDLAGEDLIGRFVSEHGQLLQRRLPDDVLFRTMTAPDPDVAYVMYTSGSTGMPKGAMALHASVLRLVLQPNYVDLDEHSKILHTGAPGFDASTFEIFGALLNGGALYQMPGDTVLDPFEVERVVRDEGINVLFLTTPLFHRWEDPGLFAPLEQLFVGGEVLIPEIAERVRRANPRLRLSNIYGPTENTTFSTFEPLTEPLAGPVPIGRPITGTYCLVLDRQLRPVPQGVPGELHVGGAGLAAGYLHQPDATAQKFIALPAHLRTEGDPESARLYRTGDRVRIGEGGSLEFLGRLDEQVKIRGHRVEPGEVEWHLNQHPSVRDGAVVYLAPRKDQRAASGRLAACYVPVDDGLTAEEGAILLESFLRTTVPPAMVPRQYLRLDRVPLNRNGKVDRAALRLLASEQTSDPARTAADRRPASAIESVVKEVWERCLDRQGIDLDRGLYSLHGDSLTAIQICAELSRRGYQLAVADLLKGPTIRECSRHVIAARRPVSDDRPALSRDYPLSPAQYRFLRRDLPNPHHFVIPLLLKLRRRVTAEEVSDALQAALADQDSHRVHFHRDATTGALRQVVRDWQPSEYFERIDLRDEHPEQHRAHVAAHTDAVCRSLDIWTGPLFRVTLFEGFENGESLLHLVFHHLISDGLSMSLLLNRLRAHLGAAGTPRHAKQSYLRWCQEVADDVAHRDVESMRAFWESLLPRNATLFLQAPHRDMRTHTAVLLQDRDELDAFAAGAADLGTTPFTILLAALTTALHEQNLAPPALHVQTSQREHGSPASGAALHDTMGYFSAALPFVLPTAAQYSGSMSGLVRRLERHMAEVLAHGRDYVLLRYLIPELDSRVRPLGDPCSMMFHYLGEDPLQHSDDFFVPADIPAGPSSDPGNPSNYLLNITVIRGAGQLKALFYYSPAHYRPDQIAALCEDLRATVTRLCESSGVGV